MMTKGSQGGVQDVMTDVFLAYVDQLRSTNPGQSYAYCFMFALRAVHFGAYHGDMTNAPPLPGTLPAAEVFGAAGDEVESMLERLHPEKSLAWRREMAERILLGCDDDEMPELPGRPTGDGVQMEDPPSERRPQDGAPS